MDVLPSRANEKCWRGWRKGTVSDTSESEQQVMAEQGTVSGYRLSPQQEHVWALQQEAAGVRYETECELVLEGEVEAGRLQRAIQEVVQEHEILRTTYRRLPELKIPVQVIEAAGQVEFEQCELQGESALGTNGAGLQVQVMK